jgi:hypothetical protein
MCFSAQSPYNIGVEKTAAPRYELEATAGGLLHQPYCEIIFRNTEDDADCPKDIYIHSVLPPFAGLSFERWLRLSHNIVRFCILFVSHNVPPEMINCSLWQAKIV